MTPKFSMVVPTVRQTHMVRECLHSLFEFEPDRSLYEVIVVDDGSDAKVQDWLRTNLEREGCRVICKGENSGFSHTVNVGIREAQGEFVVLLNNDIKFIQPWLGALEGAFRRDPKIGVVGAKLLFPTLQVQHAGVTRVGKSPLYVHNNKFAPRDMPAVNQGRYFASVTGALYAIRRSITGRVGLLNETYFLSCEDTEYSLRVWLAGFRVWYEPLVEAIHLEGGTRGNTEETKRKPENVKWWMRERETWNRFHAEASKMPLDQIDMRVVRLNRGEDVAADEVEDLPEDKVLKLEDIDLALVDGYTDAAFDSVECGMTVQRTLLKILPKTLASLARILKPGGKVSMSFVDLDAVIEGYRAQSLQPFDAGMLETIRQGLAAASTPPWAVASYFASLPWCVNGPTLQATLERFGFEQVKVQGGDVTARKSVPKNANVSSRQRRFLVKRKGALGDVIMTTPIIRRLRHEMGPEAIIHVATDCGAVLLGNPNIDGVVPSNQPKESYERVIDLDLVYERSPLMHPIDAYAVAAFGDAEMDKQTELVFGERDMTVVQTLLADQGIEMHRAVVVHPAKTWKNRTFPSSFWRQVVDQLVEAGFHPIIVGTGGDTAIPPNPSKGIANLQSRLTYSHIAALCQSSACFVGSDSGLMHVAGATEVPMVGIFTSVLASARQPFRRGEWGWRFVGLEPKISCVGCHQREPAPVVYSDCRRGDFACIGLVMPSAVVEKVQEVARR